MSARNAGLRGVRTLTTHLHFTSIECMSLFITCPVESVERATAFYTALGWTLNAEMSDHNVSWIGRAHV